MPVMVGGSKAWKVRQHGDVGVSFQWVNDEPAMILFPTRKALPGAGAFVVCLSAAFRYADSKTGAPTTYLARQAVTAAKMLGFAATDTFAARKIAGVIVDSLPDLVEMPPEPTGFNAQHQAEIGEMSVKVDGKTIAEAAVTAPTLEDLVTLQ